jgi:Fe-S cluster biogenesis protein NfuA
MVKDSELQQRMGQIEELVEEIQSAADPTFRDRAIKLVELLLEVHGAGLDRIMERVADSGPSADNLLGGFTADPLISSLLLLHGLHPIDFDTRVRQALEKVRPYLKSHKGDVELLGIDDGVIRLRMVGSCNGCPSSSATLKNAIEESLAELAPDAAGLVVEGVVPASKSAPVFVPLSPLAARGDSPASPDSVERAAHEVSGAVPASAIPVEQGS